MGDWRRPDSDGSACLGWLVGPYVSLVLTLACQTTIAATSRSLTARFGHFPYDDVTAAIEGTDGLASDAEDVRDGLVQVSRKQSDM